MSRFLALVLSLALGSFALAETRELKPTNSWSGSVDDVSLDKMVTVIADQKLLEQTWKDWNIGEKPPKIDFEKHLLIVATTSGGRINLKVQLTDEGDLKPIALATRDFRPGFRFAIAQVSRDGVKTVMGKPIEKDPNDEK